MRTRSERHLCRRRHGPRSARRPAATLAGIALGLLLALGCEREAPTPAGPPPNVVLVTIDTLRADALGAYGQELPTSPNLDALAAEGVLFEQCATSAPSTLPSHASIMTAKHPYAHGARDNAGYILTADNVTLAEVLREHGYQTAAEIAAPVIGRRTLLNQGFDQYRDLESFDVVRLEIEVNGKPSTLIERAAVDVTNHGVAFLESAASSSFFLWLHYFDPHVFYSAPPIYGELIPQSPYHAEVRLVDAQIARMIRKLRRLGLAERTLMVVTSDHGEGLGEHAESTHSYFLYETTARVPLIFWGPGVIREPRRVEALVRTVDIAPTLLELLGLPPLEDVQGVSLVPLIDGSAKTLPLTAYAETLRPLVDFGASMVRFVREGDWKYIHKVSPELYDIRADPSELDNLAMRRPAEVARLKQRLRAVLEAAPTPTADAHAEVDPTTQAHLQALGYVATSARAEPAEVASLEVSGVDPSTLGGDIQRLAHAYGYLKGGHDELAESMFRELRERHPESVAILSGLIGSLRHQGKTDEVPSLLREGMALKTAGPEYHAQVAVLMAEEGNLEGAERLMREAIGMQPCSVVAWVQLSNMLHHHREYARQLEALEEAVSRCPDATDLRNDLAYALATTPEDALRDGPRALGMAKRVVGESGGNPAHLDTLACAYAETGDYAGAQRTARRALRVLGGQTVAPEFLDLLQAHLDSFEAGEPARD